MAKVGETAVQAVGRAKAAISRAVDDLLHAGELVAELRDGYRMLRLAQEQENTGY